jgi:Arc-like DNA binding dprotein
MAWKEQPGFVQGKHRFPTELHEMVVESAKRHGRSLNQEIIIRLSEAYGRMNRGEFAGIPVTETGREEEIDRRVARMLREFMKGEKS